MKKTLLLKTMLLLCALVVGSLNGWADTYEQLTSIDNIDESAKYVLGIDGTGFHYSGTSSWGKTALPSAQTPLYYTLKKASDGKSFTAKTTISNTTYYLQIPTSNDFSMATSTSTNTSIIIGTTEVSGTNYAVANKNTTTRHLRINGTSGLRSYASTTGSMAFFYKVNSKPDAGLTFGTHDNETYTVLPGASFAAPTLTNPNSLTVSYSSSDVNIADVNTSTGAVTIGTKEGTATITASSVETDTYAAGEAKYYIKVEKGATTVTLNNSALTFNIIDGTTKTLTATAKYGDTSLDNPAITWSVQSGTAASVSDAGIVTALAPGSATIRASYAGNTTYAASYSDCVVTVNKANTALTLSAAEGAIDLKNIGARTFTLTPTVKATKSDETQVDVVNPTVTWTSSDNTIATVADGVVTGLKVGTATITATYAGGTNYNAAENATCEITVSDTRTAVNMSTFTAGKTTLVIGEEQTTEVTNDQPNWTASYTYESDDTDVATIDANGKISAVAKGTATITATLNVADNDANYKAGETISKTIDIEVTKPFHTVTFSINGDASRTASVEEGQKITFPTAADNPADETEFAKVINGMTFVGWYDSEYANSTTAPVYVNTSSTNMGDADVTYYAVYADYVEAVHDYVEDVLTPTGISNPSTYENWSGKTATSSAVYAGNSTGGNTRFQLRASDNSGIVSTTSGGRIAKVIVEWNSTSNERTLDIYGKNSAYTASSDLYSSATSTKGSVIGSINNQNATEVDINGDYSYVGLRSRSNALYINSITIKWDKGTPATYKNYNTTVSSLPRPEITMADVEMTWGDTDKSVTPTATIAGEAYEGEFTLTSSDPTNLQVDSDGKLTCNVPGTYTVTAAIAATGTYQAAEKSCIVTVNKQDVVLTFDETEVVKMVEDGEYTQTVNIEPAAYDGTISYEISGTGSATINASTAKVEFTETGVNTITATAPSTDLFNGNTASYTLKVKTTPTITVADQTLAIGETYEPTISGGSATITGNPTGLFTIEGNVITAVAIGTTTVTVATEANDTYIAGNATFTLTVNGEPEGLTETPAATPINVFYESFNNSTGSIESGWAGQSGSGTISTDNSGWTYSSSKGGAGNAIKLGKSSGNGYATTPTIDVVSGTIYTLTFKAAPWGTDASTTMSLTVTGGTLSGLSTSAMTPQQWNDYSATITATSSTMTIKFDASTDRFFLDEVHVTRPGETIESVSATISGDGDKGFGTFCSLYPLNLPADNTDYAAYIVSEVDGTNVKFQKISGEIKGGVPFILYGTPGDYDLPTAASSTTVPDGNLLSGTLAPKYVNSTDDYYCFGISKASGKFVKIKGIIPANKAYLTVEKSIIDNAGSGARELNIIFDEESGTTGVADVRSKMTDGDFYDLQGRKVANPGKGLYIVNGRKVVVK